MSVDITIDEDQVREAAEGQAKHARNIAEALRSDSSLISLIGGLFGDDDFASRVADLAENEAESIEDFLNES